MGQVLKICVAGALLYADGAPATKFMHLAQPAGLSFLLPEFRVGTVSAFGGDVDPIARMCHLALSSRCTANQAIVIGLPRELRDYRCIVSWSAISAGFILRKVHIASFANVC